LWIQHLLDCLEIRYSASAKLPTEFFLVGKKDEVNFFCNKMVHVMVSTRFAMNSVALSCALAMRSVGLAVLDNVLAQDNVTLGRLVRVLPDWSLAPIQVHAVTDTRLLPARTRLFIDFLKARLREP